MLRSAQAFGLNFLFPQGDSVIGPALEGHGEFCRPQLDFLLAAAEATPGPFVDVGANVGGVALPFAKRRPDLSIKAIEAHRDLAGVLAANTHANRLTNVEVVNAAIGACRQVVDFPTHPLHVDGNFGDSGFHQTSSRHEAVAMLPLDEIAPLDARVIKIDVQGYEPEVLRGAERLLGMRRALWFVEAAAEDAAAVEQTIELLQAAAYDLYWFYSPFVTPQAERNPRHDTTGDANIVAVPRGRLPPWKLPSVTPGEARPGRTRDYAYLARYGF